MNQFLRVVSKGKWHSSRKIDWLPDCEIQANALCDIQTQQNRLSVYRVANENDSRRVAVAIAATRSVISKVDYAVFEDSDLHSLGITVDLSYGETPDDVVNKMHYELGHLTVRRMAKLAKIIYAGKHKRIPEWQIKKWLVVAARAGHIDREKVVSEKIQKSLP